MGILQVGPVGLVLMQVRGLKLVTEPPHARFREL